MWKRVLLLSTSVALIGALVGGATFALFTASTSPAAATFTSGTLGVAITDCDPQEPAVLETPIIEFLNKAPGDEEWYCAEIRNTGTLKMIYQWEFRHQWDNGARGQALAQALQMRIYKMVDGTPVEWGDVQNYGSNAIVARTVQQWYGLAFPDFQDVLEGGGSHQFKFKVTLPLNTNNNSQGGELKIKLNVNGFQERNHGLRAQYWKNLTMMGTPALDRVDPTINYDWSMTRPIPGWTQNNWSAKWTGFVDVPVAGNYQFAIDTDDGTRVTLDTGSEDGPELIIDSFIEQAETRRWSPVRYLTAGKHAIQVEWYEKTGHAVAQLMWRTPNMSPTANPVVVPQVNLLQP